MIPLRVDKFFDKRHIGSFGEPALFVQEGQDAWGVVLRREAAGSNISPPLQTGILKQRALPSSQRHELVPPKRTHWPLDELDARLQIKAKVDEVPLDALPLVLLLLQNEHGVVEQLLQLLIGVVDAQLFKRIVL